MNNHLLFPKPRDWETFEDIVCDLLVRRYGNYNLQRYGRRGQKQYGIDIVGFTSQGLLGVQCKHHPGGDLKASEIDKEIIKAETFNPELSKLIIATSANRDTKSHSHILKASKKRKKEGKFSVSVSYWQDITTELTDFPDLLYKHFVQYFPPERLEHIYVSRTPEIRKVTATWPTSLEKLRDNAEYSLGNLDKTDPYKFSFGFTTFPHVRFDGEVDLEVNIAHLFEENNNNNAIFSEAQRILESVKSLLSDNFFSKEIYVRQKTRLSLAFLIGSTFRCVSGFDLFLHVKDTLWTTKRLPLMPTSLLDEMPVLMNSDSDQVVVSLNISRDIHHSVIEFISDWTFQPKAVVGFSLNERTIKSASHALTLSLDVLNAHSGANLY